MALVGAARPARDLREGPRGARRAPRRHPRRRGDRRDARADGRRRAACATGRSCVSAARCARRRNRLVNFDDANLRRSAQAAVAACARVERALEILGDDVPEHLRYAGELRLAHPRREPRRARPPRRPADDEGCRRRPHPPPARDGRQEGRDRRHPRHRGRCSGRRRRLTIADAMPRHPLGTSSGEATPVVARCRSARLKTSPSLRRGVSAQRRQEEENMAKYTLARPPLRLRGARAAHQRRRSWSCTTTSTTRRT